MSDEIVTAIKRFMAAHGITEYTIEKLAGGHQRVCASFRGKTARVVFPSSASCWRAAKNTLCNLRHELGLIGCNPQHKSNRVKSRRTNPSHLARPRIINVSKVSEPIASPDHPWEVLARLCGRPSPIAS